MEFELDIDYCFACGMRKITDEFEIYDVANDCYYCDQKCMDKANFIIRDRAGFVVSQE